MTRFHILVRYLKTQHLYTAPTTRPLTSQQLLGPKLCNSIPHNITAIPSLQGNIVSDAITAFPSQQVNSVPDVKDISR